MNKSMVKLATLIASIVLMLILVVPSSTKASNDISWHIQPEPGQVRKNMHFLVDRSSSMDSNQIIEAMDTAIDIATQSCDEVNIAATIFASGATRWPGFPPTKKLPPGWGELPNPDLIKNVRVWMASTFLIRSRTELSQAIVTVDENVDNLTIIVISDLEFSQDKYELMESIKAKLDRCESNTHQRPSFGMIGIDSSDKYIENAKLICMEEKVHGWLGTK